MSREEIQKLLGGYATGTLTPEEQKALFEAALDDQELFEALANEQPLRDLLSDSAVRGELLASLETPARQQWAAAADVRSMAAAIPASPAPAAKRQDRPWVWPRWWIPAGAFAAVASLTMGIYLTQLSRKRPILVATVQAPPPGPATPAAPPAAAPVEPRVDTIRTKPSETEKEKRAPEKPAVHQTAAQESKATALKDLDVGSSRPDAIPQRTEARPVFAVPPPPLPAPATAPPPPAAGASAVGGFRQAESAQGAQQAAAPKKERDESVSMAKIAAEPERAQNARELFYGSIEAAAANQAIDDRRARATGKAKTASGIGGGASGLVRTAVLPSAPPNLAVKIEVMRKGANGEFAVADANLLKPGDAVRLRLTPNDNGHVLLMEKSSGTSLLSRQAVRLTAIDYDVPITKRVATREYVLFFSRQIAMDGLTGSRNGLAAGASDQVATSGDGAVYVADKKANPAAQQISFPITLRFQ